MVRTIDGERRRRELAEAVWRVILTGGLEAASVRRVAGEAGLSTGSVRHFFTTQQQLHVFAMGALHQRVGERVQRARRITDPSERAVAMVSALLPVTDRSAAEFAVWLQFISRAAVEPSLLPTARESFDAIGGLLRSVVADLVGPGLVPADTDVEASATRLNAVVDGLFLQLLLAPHRMGRDEAVQLVRDQLAAPVRLRADR